MNTFSDFSTLVDSYVDTDSDFMLNGNNDIGEDIMGLYRHIQASKAEFSDRDYMFEA